MKASALLKVSKSSLPLSNISPEFSLIRSGLGPLVEQGNAIPVSQILK